MNSPISSSNKANNASYQTGSALANLFMRADREADAPCKEEYGWKKGATGCIRVQGTGQSKDQRDVQYALLVTAALAAAGVAGVSKNKSVKAVAGTTAAVLGATTLALPLMELSEVNEQKSTAEKIPAGGLSQERLMSYNDKFKRGDLVRHKFNLPYGDTGFHYGIYLGPDEKTKEPRMLHVNPLPDKKGTGLTVTGMKPRIASSAWEYEKVPVKRNKQINIEKRLNDVEPFIGKTIDFNIFDKNCEAVARSIVGAGDISFQTADMSMSGRTLGRNLYGKPMSAFINKGKRAEVSLAKLQRTLNKEAKKARKQTRKTRKDSKQAAYKADDAWIAYVKPDGKDTFVVKTPLEVLRLARRFPEEEMQVQIIKGYFLFLLGGEYELEQEANAKERR